MTRKFDTERLTGVVLAGGYSRRFGEADKALAHIGGEPLLERAVRRLSETADRVVVNCRTDQREAFETALDSVPVSVTFAEDPTTDCGPLFGFRVALGHVETEACALVACDTPFLDPRLVANLAVHLELVGIEKAAVGVRTLDGDIQPTQAVYRTAPAKSACRDLLDSGERRLSVLFDRLDSKTVSAEEVTGNVGRSFFDVDTPEDREQAAEFLTPDGDIPTP